MLPFTLPLREPKAICLENNPIDNIRHFRREFSLICSLTGLDKASEDVRLRFLYLTVGRAACQIIEDLTPTMPEQDKHRVDAILSRLERNFVPATQNILYERLTFNKICHSFNESLEDYAERIWQQATKCRFDSDIDGRMRDRFIAGLQNESAVDFILMRSGDNDTFGDVCNLCKLWSADNAVMHKTASVSVQLSAPLDSKASIQSSILCMPVTVKKERFSREDLEDTKIPMPIKEEKIFGFSSSMLPSPNLLSSPLSNALPSAMPSPPSPAPPTSVPPTLVPSTLVPPTSVPLTSVPPTLVPQTPVPLPVSNSNPNPPEKTPNNQNAVSSSIQPSKFDVGTFIILKKDRQEASPSIWRVDGTAMVQKYLPYRDGKLYRSSAQFRNWDPKTCGDYEKVPTQYPRKEKIGTEEFVVVEVEAEFLKPPPKKRVKYSKKKNSGQ